MMRSPTALWVLLAFQAACTGFFMYDSVLDATQDTHDGDGPVMQALEYLVTLALLAGLGMTTLAIRHMLASQARLQRQIDMASGAFESILQDHFRQWGLTPSEQDVARLAIKGLSISDMAQVRGSKEGTIKAQSAAVYRKAGVTGRLQLLSLFIEELMAEPIVPGTSGNEATGDRA